VLVKGQQVVQQRVTENFIQRIVTPHILAQGDEIACQIKDRASMKTTGLRECGLRGTHLVGETPQQLGRGRYFHRHGWETLEHAVDAGLTAQAAA
jgi:hypothetical protein